MSVVDFKLVDHENNHNHDNFPTLIFSRLLLVHQCVLSKVIMHETINHAIKEISKAYCVNSFSFIFLAGKLKSASHLYIVTYEKKFTYCSFLVDNRHIYPPAIPCRLSLFGFIRFKINIWRSVC